MKKVTKDTVKRYDFAKSLTDRGFVPFCKACNMQACVKKKRL